MKTRINLYTEAFRPAPFQLGRLAMGLAVGLLVLLVIIYGAWLQWRNQELNARYQALQAEAKTLESGMLALSKRLEERVEDPTLLQAIERESRAVRGKRQLIAHLGNGQLLRDSRFSTLMQGLSESHLEGLWLTRVRSAGEDLLLDGRSLDEELVPKWIRRLSLQKEFQGRQFGHLELLHSLDGEQGRIEFHLSTRGEDAGNG